MDAFQITKVQINTFQNNKFWTLPKGKSLHTTIKILKNMVVSSPRRIENAVGKGEIAYYEKLLLFQKSFQKTIKYSRHIKTKGLFGK